MDDDSCTHLEFQTTFKKKDLTRFARYDTFIYDREDWKITKVTTVIIYSADVKTVDKSLKIGSLTYEPISIMMCDYDGNAIYNDLVAKLKSRQELTDIDMLNLIFLPLMKNDIARVELAQKTIDLADTIADEEKRKLCKASAVSFADAYLSKTEFNTILEAIKMSEALAEFLEKEMQEMSKKADKKADEKAELKIKEAEKEIAEKLIKKGLPLADIVDLTGLDIETVKKLQSK